MAATSTGHVQCPECDVRLPITLEAFSATSESNHMTIVFEPDYTDVWAHTWSHEL